MTGNLDMAPLRLGRRPERRRHADDRTRRRPGKGPRPLKPEPAPAEEQTIVSDDAQRLALEYAERTREATARFERTASAVAFDEAFGYAHAAVRAVIEADAAGALDVARAQQLRVALPDVAALVDLAAARAARTVSERMRAVWAELGLSSDPPAWSAEERGLAAEIILLGLATATPQEPERLAATLRRLAAARFAARLVHELSACPDATWQAGLGDAYESVVTRYAPRTPAGRRGLSVLLTDERVGEELQRRLTAWFAGGAERAQLSVALEAALCHTRTPARVAR
jgi:hypothetical protein